MTVTAPATHTTAETRLVEAAGVVFAYRRFGRTGGVPLVLLQHFRGNLDNWDPALTADLQPRVERDVHLGDRAEPAVGHRVDSDDLDVEAADAAVADLRERVRHAVHAADGVGDERDPRRLAVAVDELSPVQHFSLGRLA